ncbi:MAG: hypothetical protein ACYC5N_09745 [Endomicrobiales bacterium]
MFGQSGERVVPGAAQDEKALYRDQYIFVTGQVEKTVESILAGSKTPPVIVIQSDHGSRIDPAYSYAIFNAVYLPDKSTQILSDTLSPQNTFRVLFNHYFGTKYPLLPD